MSRLRTKGLKSKPKKKQDAMLSAWLSAPTVPRKKKSRAKELDIFGEFDNKENQDPDSDDEELVFVDQDAFQIAIQGDITLLAPNTVLRKRKAALTRLNRVFVRDRRLAGNTKPVDWDEPDTIPPWVYNLNIYIYISIFIHVYIHVIMILFITTQYMPE